MSESPVTVSLGSLLTIAQTSLNVAVDLLNEAEKFEGDLPAGVDEVITDLDSVATKLQSILSKV